MKIQFTPEEVKTIKQCIDYYRYRVTKYSLDDHIRELKYQLDDDMTPDTIKLLKRICNNSIGYISQYDYAPDLPADELRQDALHPIFHVMDKLNTA